MRLVCPNCAAQYNVDDRVIPPGGRDVQCSNCGNTWFQTAAGAERPRVRPVGAPEPDPAPEPAAAPMAPAAAPAMAAAVAPPPQPVPPAATAPGRTLPAVDEDEDWEDDEPIDHLPPQRPGLAPAPPPTGAPQVQGRRVLDDAVLSILREEADRESRARQAEARGVETQGELGLPPPAPLPRRPAPVAAPLPADPPRPTGRDLLPDVETITSTLGGPAAPPGAEAAPDPRSADRSGFRLGFALMLFLSVLALGLYLLASPLAAAVPALAAPLAAYVAAVDALRLWLGSALGGLTGGAGA